jgi:hypothetical protein
MPHILRKGTKRNDPERTNFALPEFPTSHVAKGLGRGLTFVAFNLASTPH